MCYIINMVEINSTVDVLSSPEASVISSQFRAVHGRFLLGGEALNPDKKDLPEIKTQDLGNFERRNYQSFEEASLNERKQCEDKDLEVEVWAGRVAEKLSQDFSKFSGFDQARADRWQGTLAKILDLGDKSILTDPAHKEEINKKLIQLYNKYFAGEDISSVKLFVKDVLVLFNYDSLQSNLDCIEWFSQMFGKTSSRMVRHLVDAEALLVAKPNELVGELNQPTSGKLSRINEINKEEEGLLRFIWRGEVSVSGEEDEEKETVDKETKTETEDDMAPPEDLEEKKDKVNLNLALRKIRDEFLDKKKKKEIFATSHPTGGQYWWQDIIYGPRRESEGDENKTYRGYLMIEADDFPAALELLKTIGEKRKGEGKRLDFKWLLMTYPNLTDINKWGEFLSNPDNIGRYDNLELGHPRIVIYGDSSTEIEEILISLVETSDWQEIETNRIKACGGRPENAPRRPATHAFEHKGVSYRSLNWSKDVTGVSEDEAADPNWRDKKDGLKTVLIDND